MAAPMATPVTFSDSYAFPHGHPFYNCPHGGPYGCSHSGPYDILHNGPYGCSQGGLYALPMVTPMPFPVVATMAFPAAMPESFLMRHPFCDCSHGGPYSLPHAPPPRPAAPTTVPIGFPTTDYSIPLPPRLKFLPFHPTGPLASSPSCRALSVLSLSSPTHSPIHPIQLVEFRRSTQSTPLLPLRASEAIHYTSLSTTGKMKLINLLPLDLSIHLSTHPRTRSSTHIAMPSTKSQGGDYHGSHAVFMVDVEGAGANQAATAPGYHSPRPQVLVRLLG